MPLHLEEFQKDTITAYVQTMPPQRDYLLRSLMPQETEFDINFAYNVISGEYSKAASVTGWNASSPLRDKKALSQAFGEVAKIQHGVRLDEKELLSFNRPRSDQEKAQVIDYVYNTTDDLNVGVDDTEEYLRAQAIYNGRLEYSDTENDVHIDVDFGIPEENRIVATTGWADEGATPLSDIQTAVKQFQSQNQRRKPQVMHMTSATEANLLQNEQIRVQVYGNDSGQRLLTRNDLQNVFNSLGLPPYQINDDVIVLDDGEQQLLEDDKVVFIGANVGVTKVGPTVENSYSPGKFAQPIIENNPPSQTMIVGEAAFPALQRPNAIVIMSV